MTWTQIRVVFILKPRKVDYAKAEAYCLSSLSSFILKIMVKAVDRHIRDGAVRKFLYIKTNMLTKRANLLRLHFIM